MKAMPALFISHGSPTLSLDPVPARDFLSGLGRLFPKPKAILAVSAHWETDVPTLSRAEHPETIHDFYGFPQDLYRLHYPAPGAPALAKRVATLLEAAGFTAATSADRGLDHGAWVPLMLAYAGADIPVTQLSIQTRRGPAWHWRLGEALRPLRDEQVLVLASGSATHNLHGLVRQVREGAPLPYAAAFNNWLADAVTRGSRDQLLDYRSQAPEAARNHPTEEHLLPLFVAAGAGSTGRGERLHASYTYGVLAMDVYRFD